MPKINQEEYEKIKLLPDYDWNWIAREKTGKILSFKHKPIKTDEVWKDKQTRLWFNYKDSQLFQFIQWEDEEPYEIAELIREYMIKELRIAPSGTVIVDSFDESEETVMKKDIKWLKEEVGELNLVDTVFEADGVSYMDTAVSVMQVYDLIDQLDEQEVLSQEWIRNNQERKGVHFFVNVTKLQNLVVPKQEITFGQAHDKLREESILSEKSFDYYWNCINDNVEIDEPGNLLVPKQEELETKIHELIESYKQEEDAYSNPENGWISGFIEDLKNLVEKEQKYNVELKVRSSFGTVGVFLYKQGDEVLAGNNLKAYYPEKDEFRLTEQEIKNYDERFWSFAEPVE